MTKQQEFRKQTEEAKFEAFSLMCKKVADLERENRLLGERCNQLLKDKGDLTDQIADIKANCDLAIEGRDIKIKELERENAELKAFRQDCVKLTEDNVVMARQRAEIARQLTKAKEIIKDLLRLPYANDWEVYGDVTSYLDKAEQFLKEIEK